MTSAEWFVIQLLSAIFAGVFAVIAAALLFVETIADTGITNSAKQRIETLLQKISASPLADLPSYILRLSTLFLRGRDRLIAWIVVDKTGATIIGTFAALTAVAVVWIRYGLMPLFVYAIVNYLSVFLLKYNFPAIVKRFAKYLSDTNSFVLAGTAFFLFIGYTISLSASYKLYSLLMAIAISPCALVVADTLVNYGKIDSAASTSTADNTLYLAGAAVGLSVIATIIALILGAIATPDAAQIAISLQAIVANLTCDTLTLLLIFKLFASRDSADKPRNIFITVAVSLIISALLACLSLYLSFVGTANAFDPAEVLHILIGLAPQGGKFQLSPFFFLMHTTFIPAALFLLTLLLAAGVKVIVRIAMLVLGLSNKEQVNPFRAFAAMLGIFVAVFSALAAVADIMKDDAKGSEQPGAVLQRTAGAPTSYINRYVLVANSNTARGAIAEYRRR